MTAGGRGGSAKRLARAAVVLALAGAAAVAGALVLRGLHPPTPGLLRAIEGRARAAADGVPEIALVAREGQWTPNVVHAFAGRPLRLRASRAGEEHGCDDAIVVPDLGIVLPVPPAGEASATLPPARGELLFTCGSRMVKGVLLFE